MKKLGVSGQKWLKCFHVYFGCVWVGCATTLMIMQFAINPSDGRELYGIMATLDFIDLFILVPGAIGTLLTSLIYSIWTKWGWFKHYWIIIKWIICAFGIIFGTFWLGPWLSGMAHISEVKGLGAFSDVDYAHNLRMQLIFGTFQGLTLIFAVFISVLKPWKKRH
ncbi:hypothetical protein KJ966_01785 [bacterium]|nr:hypothetical protein [bacterium]